MPTGLPVLDPIQPQPAGQRTDRLPSFATFGPTINFQSASGPLFHAAFFLSANATLNNATDTLIPFDKAEEDTNVNLTLGGSFKYTCPAAGRYLACCSFMCGSSITTATTAIYLQCYKNGTAIKRGLQYAQYAGTSGNPGSVIAGVVRAVAGDTLDFRGFQNSGGNNTYFGDANGQFTWGSFTFLGNP